MSVRYSYDDFTTKGHGVIEGIWGHKKTYKKKNKNKKKQKEFTTLSKYTPANRKENIEESYRHLLQIQRTAQYLRNKSSNKK